MLIRMASGTLRRSRKKKDADARHSVVRVDVKAGVHVAPSKSVTVREAGESWIKSAEAAGLERATVKQYREHVEQHIAPFIGLLKLSEISAQTVRKFEELAARTGEVAGDGPQDHR